LVSVSGIDIGAALDNEQFNNGKMTIDARLQQQHSSKVSIVTAQFEHT
jgi:hypothetical protein